MIINLNIDDESSIEYVVNEVSKVINAGGIVISPTDTVYGMLTNAFDESAINRIYKIKEREKEKALIILLKDLEEVKKFTDSAIPKIIKDLVPNELTFIMPLSENIKLSYLDKTVALRIPKENYINKLLQKTPPIVAPSANPSNYGVIYNSDEIIDIFKDKVDLIVDAGNLEKKLPSTIYDCINNKVLRQGSIYL